ncbi:hypothetical protein [Salinarimonas sp.]|uniref:DUF6035 family protein n=1 Tax=Salinarimonas sp. TaxID=2766526 RepID=UPI0032D8ED3F
MDRRIKRVYETRLGQIRDADAILDAYASLAPLREQILSSRTSHQAAFRCAICAGELLCAYRRRSDNSDYFVYETIDDVDMKSVFFKHKDANENCPWYTGDRHFERKDKYQGRQESETHRELEARLLNILLRDGSFSDVRLEQTVVDKTTNLRRRPDISAQMGSQLLHFECQVSSPLHRDHYFRRRFSEITNAKVIWVFDTIDRIFESRKFLEIIHCNQWNGFALDEGAFQESLNHGHLHLKVFWFEPDISGEMNILKTACVAFSSLKAHPFSQSYFLTDPVEMQSLQLHGKFKENVDTLRMYFQGNVGYIEYENALDHLLEQFGLRGIRHRSIEHILRIGFSLEQNQLRPALGYTNNGNDVFWVIDNLNKKELIWSEIVLALFRSNGFSKSDLRKLKGEKRGLELAIDVAKDFSAISRALNPLLRVVFPGSSLYLPD